MGGVAVRTVGPVVAVAADTAIATGRADALVTFGARGTRSGEPAAGTTGPGLARGTTVTTGTTVAAADRVDAARGAVLAVSTVATGATGGTGATGSALTARTEQERALTAGTTVTAGATVLTRATIGAGQDARQSRCADRTVTTGTASPSGAEHSPQRCVATDATGTTVATRGDRAAAITTITAVAEPREPAGGPTIATGTGAEPVAAVTAVAAKQAALAARAAVVDATGPIGVPSRAAAAVDPAAGAAVGVGSSTVSAVSERHQPVDLTPVEGGVRCAGPAEINRSETAEVQVSQHRIPGGGAAPRIEHPVPAGRVQNDAPRRLVTPVDAEVRDGRAQVLTEQLHPHVFDVGVRGRRRSQRPQPEGEKRAHRRAGAQRAAAATTILVNARTVARHGTCPLAADIDGDGISNGGVG